MTKDQLYEKELLASLENGEWQPVKNQKKDNTHYRELATDALRKSRRVNIRISAMDLEGLQAKAAQEGLPYQTLMTSILHKYVSGRLIEGINRTEGRTTRTRAKVKAT